MEALRLKMELWRVCRPVVADPHHLDEEQDPDQDPHKKCTHQNEKRDPDPQHW